jgi:hypothetical protein
VNESNPKLLDLQSALAEMQRLREENVRLRCLLQEHGIQIPAAQSTTVIPGTTNALPSAHIPVLKAEQRIALFRSLFHVSAPCPYQSHDSSVSHFFITPTAEVCHFNFLSHDG